MEKLMEEMKERQAELVDITLNQEEGEEKWIGIARVSNEIIVLARKLGKYSPLSANEQPERYIGKGRKGGGNENL